MPLPGFAPAPEKRLLPADAARAIEDVIVNVLSRWLREYQAEWLEDQSRFKAGAWLRQHGKTEVISLESALQGLEPAMAPEQVELILSAGDEQAMEVLRKANRWTDLFDEACRKTVGMSIYQGEPTKHEIPLLTGVRIKSLPANPRTTVGYTGDVHWDEASKTPRDRDMMEAVGAVIQSNPRYRLRMTGTYWGDQGVFHDAMNDPKKGFLYREMKRAGVDLRTLKGWSRHVVTAHDVMRLGIRDAAWWDEINRMYDPATVQQDYLCIPVSGLTSVYGRELLMMATELYDDLPPLPPPAEWDMRGVRVGLGVDVGRTHDVTALVWVAEFPEGVFRAFRVRVEKGMKFPDQEAMLRGIIRSENISRVRIDATGMGSQMGETLADEFPGIVEAMKFTQGLKSDWVTLVLKMLESRRLGLLNHPDLLADFSTVRRKFLPGGSQVYDTDRTTRGHGDLYWAAALGLSALATASSWRMVFESEGILTEADTSQVGGLRVVERLTGKDSEKLKRTEDGLPMLADLGIMAHDDYEELTPEDKAALAAMEGLDPFDLP